MAGRPSAAPPSITPPEAASARRLVLDTIVMFFTVKLFVRQ
jgi:hypothetical protein